MEEILVCKNEIGVEIFDNGSKLTLNFSSYPYLKDLSEDEVLQLYLNKSLTEGR